MGKCSIMTKDEEFEALRDAYWQEIVNLFSFIKLYIRLNELRGSYLDEMNISPSFYQTVFKALWSSIVMHLGKLVLDRSDDGRNQNATLEDFLNFVEENIELFSVEAKKARLGWPDQYWAIQEASDLTFDEVCKYRSQLQLLRDKFRLIKKLRDKYHAHFDKNIFLDREQLRHWNKIPIEDINFLFETIKSMFRTISSRFDGALRLLTLENVYDIDKSLEILKDVLDQQRPDSET